MANTAGWWLPECYGSDWTMEYRAVRDAAALFDLSDEGTLVVGGTDRLDWLQRITTTDLKPLRPGQGTHACFLAATGTLQTHARCLVAEQAVFLVVEPPLVARTQEILDGFIIMEDVTVTDARSALGVLSVQGPHAGRVVSSTLNLDVPESRPLDHWEVAWGTERLRVLRHDRTGSGGLDLIAPLRILPVLFETLRSKGASPTGRKALNITRIEAGIPWWGYELGLDVRPDDAGLGSSICYTKGCYPGQEVMAKLLTRGHPSRRLWGLRFEGGPPPPAGTTVCVGDTPAGKVTSVAEFAPAVGGAAGLAILRWSAVEPGRTVVVGATPARVVELPMIGQIPAV